MSEQITPFGHVAIERLSQHRPETADDARRVIEQIDDLGVDSFRTHDSSRFPGVRLTSTSVDSAQLVANVRGEEIPAKTQDKAWIIFPGYGVLPPRAWPFMSWDMIIDRLLRVGGADTVPSQVISLGSELGLGGLVTNEWFEASKRDGFQPLAREYADVVMSLVPNKDALVILHGMSHGGLTAQQTAIYLQEEGYTRVTMRLDNPVGDHETQNRVQRVLRKIQIAAGFVGDAIYQIASGKGVSTSATDERKFKDSIFKRYGIGDDAPTQESLKQQVVSAQLDQLARGSQVGQDLPHGHRVQGRFDPVTIGFRRDTPGQINASHGITRITPEKWQLFIANILGH